MQRVSRKDNVVPDALSRISQVTALAAVDYTAIVESQKDDPELQSLRTKSKCNYMEFSIGGSNSYLFCDSSDKGPRPFIPNDFRKEVFHAVHVLAHSVIRTTNRP